MMTDDDRLEFLKVRLKEIDDIAIQGIQTPSHAGAKVCQAISLIVGTIQLFIDDIEQESPRK